MIFLILTDKQHVSGSTLDKKCGRDAYLDTQKTKAVIAGQNGLLLYLLKAYGAFFYFNDAFSIDGFTFCRNFSLWHGDIVRFDCSNVVLGRGHFYICFLSAVHFAVAGGSCIHVCAAVVRLTSRRVLLQIVEY